MSSPYSRSLPSNPDLAQQRKQAKELLHSFGSGDAEARARVRAVLPDKPAVTLADAQFVLAREYGFPHWIALREHIESRRDDLRSPMDRVIAAFHARDLHSIRRAFERHPELRAMIDAPGLAFAAPPLVSFANDSEMVELLLELGADPNRRSDWWAGGFHPLHVATGAAVERLLAAGSVPDACAAAHLDRPDLLARLLAEEPDCVHERGGDGQTPLHFARSRAVVDLLLAAGADIDARDVDHRSTPAEWMLEGRRDAGRYELARYLVDRGASADIFLAAALGLTERVRAMLEASPALATLRIGEGHYGEQPPSSHHVYVWTIGKGRLPLEVAAQFEHEETLAVMSALASVLPRLHLACRRGDAEGARALVRGTPGVIASMTTADHRAVSEAAWNGDWRAVALMLELGFDPRTPGHDSGTALHCASWQGSLETVAVLLRHAAATELLSIRDARYDFTPLGWCCHGSLHGDATRDHAGVARLLLEAGAQPGRDTATASPRVAAVLARGRGAR